MPEGMEARKYCVARGFTPIAKIGSQGNDSKKGGRGISKAEDTGKAESVETSRQPSLTRCEEHGFGTLGESGKEIKIDSEWRQVKGPRNVQTEGYYKTNMAQGPTLPHTADEIENRVKVPRT